MITTVNLHIWMDGALSCFVFLGYYASETKHKPFYI